MPHTAEETRWQREPLPDYENAFELWIEAAKALVPLVDLETAELESRGLDYCNAGLAVPMLALPAGEIEQAYRENVSANRRSLELIDAGIDRGSFQFPDVETADGGLNDLTMQPGLRELIWLRQYHTRLLASDGELAAAGRMLLRSLDMTEMILLGNGDALQFLIGEATRRSVLASIRAFAFPAQAPAKELTELFAALGRFELLHTTFVQAVRRDFHCCCVPVLERLAAASPLGELVDSLLENYYRLQPILPADDPAATDAADDRNTWRREKIINLLEGHPAPFDIAETLRLARAAVAAAEDDLNINVASVPLVATAREEPAAKGTGNGDWPEHLSPGLPYEYIGDSPSARAHRDELRAVLSIEQIDSIGPPSDAALAVAKTKLRRTSNPAGRMLVAQGACLPIITRAGGSKRILADEVATRTILALRLHVDRFGRAPNELSELVTAGLLSDVPLDVLSGRPLRYSRDRELLWSVGLDRKDGDGDPISDMVWRVPVTK